MTPGPLGIADTSPSADAPQRIASLASAIDAIQQILICGVKVGKNRLEARAIFSIYTNL
jgi:hypothetical protein